MAQDDPSTTDPEGRRVVFDAGTRLDLALGRPELMDEVLIVGTVPAPTTGRLTRFLAESTSIAAM